MRAPRSLTFPISPTSLSKYHHPIKKRKDREKKKKKKISLPILSVSISFEASKDICLLGKKGTRKEKKRKGEEDKRTHARRRLRLIYDCFEKNFEKKDRENRVRGGEGGGRRGEGGREKLYAGRRRDELQLRILRITILLTSFSLLRGTGRNGFRLLVVDLVRPALDSSWMLLLRGVRSGRQEFTLSPIKLFVRKLKKKKGDRYFR